MMKQIFYVDGATKHNGQAGKQKSYICVTDSDGNVIVDDFVGDRSNNQTEVLSILAALKHIVKNKIENAVIKSDSQLVVQAINRQRKVGALQLVEYITIARSIINTHNITIKWIPREKNKAGWYLERKYEKGWREYWPQPEEDFDSILSNKTQKSIDDFIRWINRQSNINRVDEYRIFTWWVKLAKVNKETESLNEAIAHVDETIRYIRSHPMKQYRN